MKMNFYSVVCVVFFASFVVSYELSYTDCGPKNIHYLDVSPCTKDPCRIPLNTNVTLVAKVEAAFDSRAAINDIRGYIKGKEFGLPDPPVDACKANLLTPTCPIKKGHIYQYVYTLDIHDFYPAVPVTIQYQVRDERKRLIACAKLNVIIYRP